MYQEIDTDGKKEKQNEKDFEIFTICMNAFFDLSSFFVCGVVDGWKSIHWNQRVKKKQTNT